MENSSEKMPENISKHFKKEERLTSKKAIEKLFAEGDSFLVYPFKVVYLNTDFPDQFLAKVAFAVSKKLYKKAVLRNLIKRRMRESYRLNKHMLHSADNYSKKSIIFIYIGKEILPFQTIKKAMVRTLGLLRKKTTPNP